MPGAGFNVDPARLDAAAVATYVGHAQANNAVSFLLGIVPSTVFDAFANEEDRQAHLGGNMANALMSRVDEMLAKPPSVERLDVLAMKNERN